METRTIDVAVKAAKWLLLTIGTLLLLCVAALAYFELRKQHWDEKVADMCEKQGGAKVYKRINLSPEEYERYARRYGPPRVPHQDFASAADPYVYTFNTEHIVEGDLNVRKHVTRIIERQTSLVLSEHVGFSRIGGDFLWVAHPTSFSCPLETESLFELTFRKGQRPQ